MASIFVSGAAGFIGYHLCKRLAKEGHDVFAVDEFNNYYSVSLKKARAAELKNGSLVAVQHLDIADSESVAKFIADCDPEIVIHLAAQAGVRYSIDNPFSYQRANVQGHLSILEACRTARRIRHLLYASSSSVYGDRPISGRAFSETDAVDSPASLYAATKRACELISHTYSSLYKIPQTGLRFFTVYGPWGRPDMAYFSFTRRILRGEPIEIYGEGRLQRDFTYIDDIISSIYRLIGKPPESGSSRIINIGSSRPYSVLQFVNVIENACQKKAQLVMRPMQLGDVTSTWADTTKLKQLTGYEPETSLDFGLSEFVRWYKGFYHDDGTERSSKNT